MQPLLLTRDSGSDLASRDGKCCSRRSMHVMQLIKEEKIFGRRNSLILAKNFYRIRVNRCSSRYRDKTGTCLVIMVVSGLVVLFLLCSSSRSSDISRPSLASTLYVTPNPAN